MIFQKLFGYLVEPHFLDDKLNKLKGYWIIYRFLSHIMHPVHEWLHTRHEQILYSNYYEVKHYRFNSLVTIDKIEPHPRGNYKGKNEFKNQRFVLLERRYNHGFSLDSNLTSHNQNL